MKPIQLAVLLALALPTLGRASDVVGTYNTPGEARHVAVVGSLAYVADGTGGLRILDISVPAAPIQIGALANPAGNARDVVVAGSLAYVALGLGGVAVADVSIPTAPHWLGVRSLGGGSIAVDLEVAGTHAYVAGSLGGLRIVDFTTPTAPVEVGFATVGNDSIDVELSGSVAWLAATSGVYGFDVSIPSAPALLSQPIIGTRSAIEVIGDRLYTNNLEVFDIGNPAAPIAVAAEGILALGDVELGDDTFVGMSSGLWIGDASDPDRPLRYGDLTGCGGDAIEVVGRYAYCADFFGGFNVYDVTDPMLAKRVASIPELQAQELDVLGSYAYVAAEGLSIIDVSNPTAPVIVSTLPTPASDVEVWGGVAYVAAGSAGFSVIDVSNPLLPFEIASVPFNGTSDLDLVGDRLYVAAGFTGFLVFDVSEPSAPALLGFFLPVPHDFTEFVEVQNDVAFVTVRVADRLLVLDVSDPSVPVTLADVPLASVNGIELSGDLLYVTHASSSFPALTVLDVSDPSAPVPIGTMPSLGSGNGSYDDIRIIGDVGLPSDGIALDLSDPTSPRAVGVEPQITGGGIERADGLVFLSDLANGIRIVEPSVIPLPRPECSNGSDDDGDTKVDYPADPTCLSASDPTELPDCSDGTDNDRDGFRDYPADPSCAIDLATNETRPCSDGLDNDGDGRFDADDPHCGNPSNPEKSCGLGAELVLVFGLARRIGRRQRARGVSVHAIRCRPGRMR